MVFSSNLRSLRKYRGYTQQEVAIKLGIDRTTYNKYETGKSEPDYDILCKLADLFGVSTDYLIGHSDYPHPGEIAAAHIDGGKTYDDLTPEALQQLEEYKQFLIQKYGKKKE
ncbi:MAG: helix-turn-helix domain-containing protein [Burkholderiales bacterium]